MADVNKLLQDAILEISKLNHDEEFLVKDLFYGYKWKRIPIKDRILLGTLFLNYVNKNAGLGISPIEKTTSNQQKYKKK